MRNLLLALSVLLTLAPAAPAQSMYVNDVVQVTLRTGPGYDHKIRAVLKSGDALEVLQPGEEWSRVRTAEGGEGWVLSRLLTGEEPNALKLRRLQARLDSLEAAEGREDPEGEALRRKNLELENALTELRFELDAARQAYRNLETEAGEYLDMRRALEKTKARFRDQAEELQDCRRRLADRTDADRTRWFLVGAGVLLLGLLLGMGLQRRRRRSGLL